MPVVRGVTLTQLGRLPVTIEAQRFVPADSAFELLDSPQVVGVDEARELEFRYLPTKAATDEASVVLTLDDGQTLVIALSGRGVDARVKPSLPIDFGRPAVGEVRGRTLTLTNDFETAVPAAGHLRCAPRAPATRSRRC